MKAFITIIVLVALVVFVALSVKWAIGRSKSDKTSLQRSFTGKSNPDDNLGKMRVGGVSGLPTKKEQRRSDQ